MQEINVHVCARGPPMRHFLFLLCIRYFTRTQLAELFQLEDPRFSNTQRQIEQLHANQRKTDTKLDAHIAFLHTLGKL